MRLSVLITILTIFYSTYSFSQVTIGSGIIPAGGALLDLKEESTTGTNSTRGFLLPRVFLTQVNNLTDIAGTTAPNANLAHVGLCVFNTNPSYPGGIGINVWDGALWVVMKSVLSTPSTIKTGMTAFNDPGSNLLSLSLGSPTTNWKYFAFNNKFVDTKAEYNKGTGVFTTLDNGTYDISIRVSLTGVAALSTFGVAVYKKPSGGSTFTQLFAHSETVLLAAGSIEIEAKADAQTLNAGDQLMFAVRSNALLTLATGDSALSYGIVTQR